LLLRATPLDRSRNEHTDAPRTVRNVEPRGFPKKAVSFPTLWIAMLFNLTDNNRRWSSLALEAVHSITLIIKAQNETKRNELYFLP
jgi:hypothetical protein